MELQEGSILKYLDFRIFQSPLGFSVDHTYHIMKLVNKWFPTGKFKRLIHIYSTYEKELIDALSLTLNDLHNTEMEYNEKNGHTLGSIQHIAIMSIIDIFYATCRQ